MKSYQNYHAWEKWRGQLHVRGDLFGIGRETLMNIGTINVPKEFYVSFHTGRIIKRFVRLALNSGADMEEIECILRRAECHPGKLLQLLQNHMHPENDDGLSS